MPLYRDLLDRLKPAGAGVGGPGAYVPLTSNELDDRFNSAIIASIIVHTFLIFGLTFKAANPALLQYIQPLEVVLVNARSLTQPLHPEVYAQHSLAGGGDVEEDRQAKSPLPASERDAPPSTQSLDSQIKSLEAKTRQLMAQVKSNYAINPERNDTPTPPKPVVPAPVNLAEASLEMARLQARISTEWDEYQKRPRRAFVGANAQEYSYARYIEDWRLKVERIGNLNYPEAARRDRIHGSLELNVSVRYDGYLERAEITRSSGSRILDAAALRIVEMAQPYAPFTEEMRKKADIINFSKVWQFTTSDQLTGQ
jgi:protein TonB